MNFRSHTRRRTWSNANTVALVVGLCILLGLFARGFIAKKIAYLGDSIYEFFPNFKSSQKLLAENQRLSEEVSRLMAENADRDVLARENELLRAGFGREEGERVVYAVVIKHAPNSPYDTFILDAGDEAGIAVGDNVVFGSVLIGNIVEAGNGYSKAKLLSSEGNIFEGILGEGTPIEVKGLGGGAFEAMLPLGMEVASGDALILPSLSPKIFGLVQKIEDKSDEGFKRLLFSLPVNPNQINSVGVIIK